MLRCSRLNWACLQFLGFCSNQAEDVCPKRIRVALAVEVSGCFCSGSSLPTSSVLVAKLRALDSGPCDSSTPTVLRVFSNLMHCLLGWRFERLAIVCLRPRPKGRVVVTPSASLLQMAGEHSLHRSSALSVPRGFAVSWIALISLHWLPMTIGPFSSALAGRISSSACASATFPRSSALPSPLILSVFPG